MLYIYIYLNSINEQYWNEIELFGMKWMCLELK